MTPHLGLCQTCAHDEGGTRCALQSATVATETWHAVGAWISAHASGGLPDPASDPPSCPAWQWRSGRRRGR